MIEFESKEYAILLNLAEASEAQQAENHEASTVIMQLIQKDDQAVFSPIESDEEFERVIAFVREMAGAKEREED